LFWYLLMIDECRFHLGQMKNRARKTTALPVLGIVRGTQQVFQNPFFILLLGINFFQLKELRSVVKQEK
jgi:hypothetical protein